MLLKTIHVANYKSVRDVLFEPANFSVLVGRNASGKSNFADALDFLGLVYSHGLEHAVARKGGYENIAHRKERRSKSAIGFSVALQQNVEDIRDFLPGLRLRARTADIEGSTTVRFEHHFSFRAAGEGIRSEFAVVDERLSISATYPSTSDLLGQRPAERVELVRDLAGKISINAPPEALLTGLTFYEQFRSFDTTELQTQPTELLLSLPFLRPRLTSRFVNWLTHISTFQVSPDASRHPGVPTPNPTLSIRGENLPAVVDWLQSKRPDAWKTINSAMQEIVPELEYVTVDYLHTRTLGLFFKERGVGRTWTAEEVSDGTIRALAMLTACFDPRVTLLVLEEPENSLHPWIIKAVVEQVRKLSQGKTVILTTHSPVVLNAVHPNDVWVVHKSAGETRIEPLHRFDSQMVSDWEKGKYRLFDYLESGAVTEAVPSG